MKTFEETGSAEERHFLISMITNSAVLAKVMPIWKPPMFHSPWSDQIGNWCVDYYKEYNEAPGQHIDSIFRTWAETALGRNKATVESIEVLLTGLSTDYERYTEGVNSDFVVEEISRYFYFENAARSAQAILAGVATKNTDGVKKAFADFAAPDLGEEEFEDTLTDDSVWQDLFNEPRDPLIEYPGALGQMFGNSLERDGFVVLQAQSKSCKSFMLLDMAMLAVSQRRKVVYFQAGDMSRVQVHERLGSYMGRKPYYCDGEVYRIPTSLIHEAGDLQAACEYTDLRADSPLTYEDILKGCDEFRRKRIKSLDSYFKLKCFHNDTLSVSRINSELKRLSQEKGYDADVCIAEGSLVLTDHGLIPIEKVTCSDRLWDGLNWVTHDGPVFKGIKDVIEYAGITATPEHEVWTEEGRWRTLESCRRLGLRIAKTGDRERRIRVGEDYIGDNPYPRIPVPKERKSISGKKGICICEMCAMREREVGDVRQYQEGNIQGVSELFAASSFSEMALESVAISPTALSESEFDGMASVWGKRNRISISYSGRRLHMGDGSFGLGQSHTAIGSDRQRRPLRTGKSSTVHKQTEYSTHEQEKHCVESASIPAIVSVCDICGRNNSQIVYGKGADSGTDCGKVENYKNARRPVWDLLNAGPLHRFTVQGLLVHNCVIDYADLLADPPGEKDPRDRINKNWKMLSSLRTQRKILIVTATQSDADSYGQRLQTKKNFSNDRRKNDHVTAMFALNQLPEEKETQIFRINCLGKRQGKFNPKKEVYVAGCLEICRPVILSCW